MANRRDLLIKIQKLRDLLVDQATGHTAEEKEYESLRKELLIVSNLKYELPVFLETCENLEQFWRFIKTEFSTWADRRNYLRKEFKPAITLLSEESFVPKSIIVPTKLIVNSEYVQQAWQKALERRATDPDGAITAARTLLEEVCKHILDESGVTYEEKDDLPKLYKMTSENIELAPTQHTDELIKKILGGCHVVVVNLGELRNKIGDAHGKGKAGVKPNSLHAELAVHLAGAMANFLITSWEEKNK